MADRTAAVKRYDISNYLTDDQKRRALAHEYRAMDGDGLMPRDIHLACPLQRALWQRYAWHHSPPGFLIATRIKALGSQSDRAMISRAATEFVDDWDEGKIAPDQLAIALGAEHLL